MTRRRRTFEGRRLLLAGLVVPATNHCPIAALVNRLVYHAEVLVPRGDSYRLKGKGKGKEVLQGDDRDRGCSS
jgi:hypothetical protein